MRWLVLLCCYAVACLTPMALAQKTSYNLNKGPDNSKWMSTIRDETRVTQLSLPGTHNSFTYSWAAGGLHPGTQMAECQDDTIENQLRAGIRFLDIRLKMKRTIGGRLFRVVHNLVDTSLTMDEVLTKLNKFLDANPSEVIFARVSKDYGDGETPTQDFHELWEKKYWPYGGQKQLSKRLFDVSTTSLTISKQTLGNLRGKIVVLYEGAWKNKNGDNEAWGTFNGHSYGYPYGDLIAKDEYTIKSAADMDVKETQTRQAVFGASASTDLSKFFVTYTSGSSGSFGDNTFWPKPIASGVNDKIEGQNPRTYRLLTQLQQQPIVKTGAIMMDVPGPDLVQAILVFNNQFR